VGTWLESTAACRAGWGCEPAAYPTSAHRVGYWGCVLVATLMIAQGTRARRVGHDLHINVKGKSWEVHGFNAE
jgi:hypothetical protein